MRLLTRISHQPRSLVTKSIFIVMSVTQSLMAEYPFMQSISLVQLAFSTYHSIALTLVFLFSIITGWGRKYEGINGEPVPGNPVRASVPGTSL